MQDLSARYTKIFDGEEIFIFRTYRLLQVHQCLDLLGTLYPTQNLQKTSESNADQTFTNSH